MRDNYHYGESSGRAPADLAQEHCSRLPWPEQVRFMDQFTRSRAWESDGRDTYLHWRAIQDDSVLLAGYLEGLASTRRSRGG